MTRFRLAMCLSVLGVLLFCTGVTYGLVGLSLHSNYDCGKSSNGPYLPGPNPCARVQSDWRTATWFLVPGLAGLIGACGIGLSGTVSTANRPMARSRRVE